MPQNKPKTLFHTNFLINHFKTNVTVGKKIPTATTSEVTLQSKEHLGVEKWISVDQGWKRVSGSAQWPAQNLCSSAFSSASTAIHAKASGS